MPGSHAEEIVGDYYESDDWAESFAEDAESEPDLDLPPLPPLRPEAASDGLSASSSLAFLASSCSGRWSLRHAPSRAVVIPRFLGPERP